MPNYFYSAPKSFDDLSEYVIDKDKSANGYFNYQLLRLQQMFHYENLPDTIPKEILENYLLVDGKAFITEVNGKLYVFFGTLGGEPDEYYRPTKYIIANPALNFYKECKIGEDGILMRNDSLWVGLYPLLARYSTLMCENCLTLHSVDIILRAMLLLTAPDDATKRSADLFLQKLNDGKIGAIAENRFFDGIKMQSPPSNNGSYLTQFIELHQYYKGSFFNEIGLNANFNMKRESIGEGESSLNEDSLLPLCDEMLKCRQDDIEKVNEMFGTNIKVSFNSAWANNEKEIILQMKKLESESEMLDENSSQLAENEVSSQLAENEENEVSSQLAENEENEVSSQLAENEVSSQVEEENEDSSQLAENEHSDNQKEEGDKDEED